MLDTLARAVFHGLASSRALKRLASRYGLRDPGGFARRFIAGERVEDAIGAARAVEARGLLHTLNYLGEGVTSLAGADAATRAYLDVIERTAAAGIGRNLSIKLTQIGLDIDRATCVDNLRRILDAAGERGQFVRIDMESSAYTDLTLDIFETVWQQEYRNAGVVLQSYLYRSEDDLRRINRLGARIRLVKGAYHEPKRVAYPRKADVDAAFLRMMRVLLVEGTYAAIATHDERIIAATEAFAADRKVSRDAFEFQMLYGIHRRLQASLAAGGYRVRIYIPFGAEWYPYFMRRLGERPANVAFVIRSLLQDR